MFRSRPTVCWWTPSRNSPTRMPSRQIYKDVSVGLYHPTKISEARFLTSEYECQNKTKGDRLRSTSIRRLLSLLELASQLICSEWNIHFFSFCSNGWTSYDEMSDLTRTACIFVFQSTLPQNEKQKEYRNRPRPINACTLSTPFANGPWTSSGSQ